MQINEATQLAINDLELYRQEYIELNKIDPIKYPIQVDDKRSNVFYKFLAEKLENKSHKDIDRYTLNVMNGNKRYSKRVDSINTLKSKTMAIISKDKSEINNNNRYLSEK